MTSPKLPFNAASARSPTGVDRQRQLTDTGTGIETVALAQQHRLSRTAASASACCPASEQPVRRLSSAARVAVSLLGKAANISQHRAGPPRPADRGRRGKSPAPDRATRQSGVPSSADRPSRPHPPPAHQMQSVATVIAHALTVRLRPQQTVQRRRLRREQRLLRRGQRQLTAGAAATRQARRRLAGRCRQLNAQARAFIQLHQRRQQLGDGGALPCQPAGNDRDTPCRVAYCGGDLLPIGSSLAAPNKRSRIMRSSASGTANDSPSPPINAATSPSFCHMRCRYRRGRAAPVA